MDQNDNEPRKPARRHLTIIKAHSKLSLVPTVEAVMNDAISLLAKEVAEMQSRYSRPGVQMSVDDSAKLSKFVKSLVEISREERAREAADDLSKMSNEQLMEIAAQHMKQIEKEPKQKSKPPGNDNGEA